MTGEKGLGAARWTEQGAADASESEGAGGVAIRGGAGQSALELGDALAQRVLAVIKRLDLEEASFPCVLTGGNLAPGPLAERLTGRLHQRAPHAQVIRPQVDAAVGAAWLARAQVDRSLK